MSINTDKSLEIGSVYFLPYREGGGYKHSFINSKSEDWLKLCANKMTGYFAYWKEIRKVDLDGGLVEDIDTKLIFPDDLVEAIEEKWIQIDAFEGAIDNIGRSR